MGSSSARVVSISLLTFAAALLVFLVYSIGTFQPRLVLSPFLWRWVWNQSAIFFIEALIPLECTALLIYYSLFAPLARGKRTRGPYEPFYRLVNSVLVTLLLFTLLFTVLAEGVRPWLYGHLDQMLNETRLAHLYYSKYQTYRQTAKFSEAQRYLALYLKIDPGDRAAQGQMDRVRLEAAKEHLQASSSHSSSPTSTATQYENESERSLVAIARSYLRGNDYASAHYYANLALTISPGNAEAQRLSRETLVDLSRITTTPAEREQKYYFALKSKGRADLQKGDAVGAYYLFDSLSRTHPKDPDVVTYLRRATAELTGYAFFKNEVEKAGSYPGRRDVLFVNQRNASGTEILLFRKMITLISGTYIEGVEAIRFTPLGKLDYEITAPYGKIIGNRLSMYCIERDRAVSYLPTVVAGTFPDSTHYEIPLSATVGTLDQIASLRHGAPHSGMPELWTAAGLLPRYGYSAEPLRFEFLRRAMIPFAFLILSIFSIALGWSLRISGKRPAAIVFLLLPLIPYVIYLFETFYLFSGKVLFGFIMTVAGFWPALLVLLAVQFVLVILSLIFVAGQATEQ